jgi:thiosulfate dehydrogenase (quinone) large subunit
MKRLSCPDISLSIPIKMGNMNKENITDTGYSRMQLLSLTFLRVLIGWHFLYEGLVKLYAPGGWTSEFFLLNAVGPFSGFLKSLAANDTILFWVDKANIWGLILIGISLFIGIFTRFSQIFGLLLIFLYYISYPPLASYPVAIPVEGSYWIVNKNLIEFGALLVLCFFPSSHITGLDRLLKQFYRKK